MKKIICLAISVFFVFNITSLRGMKTAAGDATKAIEKDKKERPKSNPNIEQKKANDKVEHYPNRANKDENANNDVDGIVEQRQRDKLDNANWEQNEFSDQLQYYSKNDEEVENSYIDQPPYVPFPSIYQDNINMTEEQYLPSYTEETEHRDNTNQISKVTDDWHQEEEMFRVENTNDDYLDFSNVEPVFGQDTQSSNNGSTQIGRLRKAKRENKNPQVGPVLGQDTQSPNNGPSQIERLREEKRRNKNPQVEPVSNQYTQSSNNESSQIGRLRETKRRNKNF